MPLSVTDDYVFSIELNKFYFRFDEVNYSAQQGMAVIPVPKHSRPKEINDLRPVRLTSVHKSKVPSINNDTQIEGVRSYKYLGIQIDDQLKFDICATSKVKKKMTTASCQSFSFG